MNLSRSLARYLSSSNRKKWTLLRPIVVRQTSTLSSDVSSPAKRTYKRNLKPSTWISEGKNRGRPDAAGNPSSPKVLSALPKPSEIPFQTKVANTVHLVGKIGAPVQLQTLPDGIYAVSVLVHEKRMELPQFWVPVIFRGDLGQIAACHLKEGDLVQVSGQLSGDAPPFTTKDVQTNIQVLAHSLSFVKVCPENEGKVVYQKDEAASSLLAANDENSSKPDLRKDGGNPHSLWDNRSSKDSGSTVKKRNNSADSLWRELVDNPKDWQDKRGAKQNGLVKQNYPDFKSKDTKKAVWLSSAPDWVLPKLDGLFGSNPSTTKQPKDDNAVQNQTNHNNDLWKNLVENPDKWWDNRSNKLTPKYPDFKHKETGEALWLGSSTPSWALQKLPPLLDTKQDVARK